MPPPEEKGRLKRFKSDADALHAVFDKYRQSGDLDREHLAVALAHLKLSPQRLEEIFVRADSDRDGKISFEEFFTFVSRHEAELRTAFNTIDADKSGTIQRHEVEQLLANLNMHCTEEKLTAVFDMMDVNHDGSVDFNEFHEAFALLDPEDLLLSLDEASAGQEGATPSELADIRRLLYRLPRIGSTPGAQPPPASKAKVGLVQQLLPGGLAGAFAQSVVQPVETLKVRLQMEAAGRAPAKYHSLPNALMVVVREEGVLALWKGIQPSWLRELSYSSLRFGLYKPIKVALGAGTPRDTPLWKMIVAGSTAGGLASAVASPTDLLKTRMQGEPVSRSMMTHAAELYSQGGVAAFWRGATPTLTRGAMIGGVKLATYDSAKLLMEDYAGMRKGTVGNFCGASILTACNTVLWTAPADFLRTQIMVSDGSRSAYRVAADVVSKRGPLVLWNGWLPQILRLLPYNLLQATMMEKIAAAMGSSIT